MVVIHLPNHQQRHPNKSALPLSQFEPNNPSNVRNGPASSISTKHQLSIHPSRSKQHTAFLVTFRIVVITVIFLCIVWFYFIFQIASSIDRTGNGQVALIKRPLVDYSLFKNNDNHGSQFGWMLRRTIRQKIKQIQQHLEQGLQNPVPLLDVSQMDSPILIFTCQRAEYLERTLWKVFQHHPAHSVQGQQVQNQSPASKWRRIVGAPIIISQDGDNDSVKEVIDTYRPLFELKLGVPLYRVKHDRADPPTNPESLVSWEFSGPYVSLAKHYGWALEKTFSGEVFTDNLPGGSEKHRQSIPQSLPLPKRVIILEEDIEISRDFFSYMNATADLLDFDSTLLAVSGFNDNGKEKFVADSKRLLRSDFFPGLGWMIPRRVWEGTSDHPKSGLKLDWAPNGFWDDWIREPNIRNGRHILRPEVSRTFHFGNVQGASQGENIAKLSEIELDEVNVHWEEEDLSYLEASLFARKYWNRVSKAKIVTSVSEAKSLVAHNDVRLVYSNWDQFSSFASQFGIMSDEKAGVPRTAYEGIVEIRYGRGDFFIFLTPPYVNEGPMPSDFGNKAWMDFNKDSLLQRLGISTIGMENRPPIDFS